MDSIENLEKRYYGQSQRIPSIKEELSTGSTEQDQEGDDSSSDDSDLYVVTDESPANKLEVELENLGDDHRVKSKTLLRLSKQVHLPRSS